MTSDPPLPNTGWDWAGIKYRNADMASLPTVIVVMPLAWVVFPAMTIVVMNVFSNVARRRRLRLAVVAGRCYQCGYDLRASPDRCPECGTMKRSRPSLME